MATSSTHQMREAGRPLTSALDRWRNQVESEDLIQFVGGHVESVVPARGIGSVRRFDRRVVLPGSVIKGCPPGWPSVRGCVGHDVRFRQERLPLSTGLQR